MIKRRVKVSLIHMSALYFISSHMSYISLISQIMTSTAALPICKSERRATMRAYIDKRHELPKEKKRRRERNKEEEKQVSSQQKSKNRNPLSPSTPYN